MRKQTKMVIAAVMVLPVVYAVVSIVLFDRINVPFMPFRDDEVARIAVNKREVTGRQHIICTWERTTGFNYMLVQDENGVRTNSFCRVTGVELERELSYQFLISGNHFVFYVVEKKQYYDYDLGDVVTEYIVDDWDVLYPVRRQSLFNTAPRYILYSDTVS